MSVRELRSKYPGIVHDLLVRPDGTSQVLHNEWEEIDYCPISNLFKIMGVGAYQGGVQPPPGWHRITLVRESNYVSHDYDQYLDVATLGEQDVRDQESNTRA
jgi:hypothetical protein